MTISRQKVEHEFDRFFEFDTKDHSVVTSASAKLFAIKIGEIAIADARKRMLLLRELHPRMDAITVEACLMALQEDENV